MKPPASWTDDDPRAPLLFAYGALMQGMYLHHHLAGATFAGRGWTRGRLVALGDHPGLIDGMDEVRGELYRLRDAAATLEALDDLEGFDPADPQSSLYVRVGADVHIEGGVIRAWMYRYNKDPGQAPLVSSGDWRSYCSDEPRSTH